MLFLASCSSFVIVPEGYTTEDELIYKKIDEFKQRTFYTPKVSFANTENNPIYFYISKGAKDKILFLDIRYEGYDWIFWNTAIIISGQDRITITVNRYGSINTSVCCGGIVFEECNNIIGDQYAQKLKQMALSGNEVKLRLSGKYYKDYVLSQENLSAIVQIIDLYKSM